MVCIRIGVDFEDLHNSLTNLLATVADSEVASEIVQKTTEVATSGESPVHDSTLIDNLDAASTVASKSGPFTAIADALEYILKVILKYSCFVDIRLSIR